MYKTKTDILSRAVAEGRHIVNTEATLRETALLFDVCKSTTHKDVTDRLWGYYPELATDVAVILAKHREEFTMRATLAKKKEHV